MSDSLINIIINTVKRGGGDKEAISGIRKLNANFKELTGINLGAASALGVAGIALKKMYGYSKEAIESASEMSETQSKVNVVFGESSEKILEFGRSAAESMGMSNQEALAGAAVFGNLFSSMEMGPQVSAEMSMGLVQLASDLASFNNMDPTAVLDKLRAGISGESEPLKALGVNINEVIIKEKARELGLWNGVGALTASQKASASYALIMEQTTLAQGDFLLTSEGLANQQRILKSNIEDLSAIIGKGGLLTLEENIIKAENQMLEGILDRINAYEFEAAILEKHNIYYDNRIGYMREGKRVTLEEVEAIKSSDIALQAMTARLEAQAEAWYTLHPELRQGTAEFNDLANAGDAYYSKYENFAQEETKYKESLEEVRGTIRDLTAEKVTLLEKGYHPEGAVVREITEKLSEQGMKAQELATAHELATQRIILGYVQQQLAVDGLSRDESQFLIDMGVKWGIYGEDVQKAYEAAMTSVDNFVRMQGNVQTHQVVNVDINYTNHGQPGFNIPTLNIEEERAAGGPVSAYKPYLVGEAGPEIFVPRTNGEIVPNHRLGGNTIYINVNGAGDPNMVANAVMRKLRLQGVS